MQNRNPISIDLSPSTNPFDIASNPRWFHTHSLRTLAWAALKADRGETIHQHRLQVLHAAQPSLTTAQGI